MDIFFHDPEDLPLPPDEVHIRNFAARPYPGGQRVRVYLEISPFERRPSAEVRIYDPEGRMVSTVSIIETIDPRLEMTMHLRGRPVSGEHVIDVELYYDPDPEEADEDGEELKLQERKIIDSSRQHFVIDPE